MKLKQNQNSTPVQISDIVDYYNLLSMQSNGKAVFHKPTELKAPNPPTPEAVKKAQFVDKTYRWTGK